MTTHTLSRVALIHPLPDMGDRNIQGITTLISSAEWRMEADYQRGSVGDVTVYRNTSVNAKEAEPTWEWYAGIPTANIKAYRLEEPAAHGESQTQNPPAKSASGSAKQ